MENISTFPTKGIYQKCVLTTCDIFNVFQMVNLPSKDSIARKTHQIKRQNSIKNILSIQD